MTTLALLKTRIATDLDRDDLTTEIGEAITDAIRYYRAKRFYFNETRSQTFNTIAGQIWYGVSDAAFIPLIKKIDGVYITVSGQRRLLERVDPETFELISDDSGANGDPYSYTYYNQQLGLYPVAGSAYEIRVTGVISLAAPSTDAEADNAWMTEAFELIRCRAKAYLQVHRLGDPQAAAVTAAAEGQAFSQLVSETVRQTGTGIIRSVNL